MFNEKRGVVIRFLAALSALATAVRDGEPFDFPDDAED